MYGVLFLFEIFHKLLDNFSETLQNMYHNDFWNLDYKNIALNSIVYNIYLCNMII